MKDKCDFPLPQRTGVLQSHRLFIFDAMEAVQTHSARSETSFYRVSVLFYFEMHLRIRYIVSPVFSFALNCSIIVYV